ncbi:MCE family protein [Mycobacterium sp. pUA109]|uniref:MCE family protein n=1 Tax=Mycobacterium sp. pUA109 TaxID=3238982 RepID=UPI00351BD4A2
MRSLRRVAAIGGVIAVTGSACAFQGVNSLPLPGAVGRGAGADIYHVEIANVAILESNSPVMINNVFVGSVAKIGVKNWHAVVDVSVLPNVAVPGNAVASIGQTSLLGSMHLALDPPVGQRPAGRLAPGATIGLNRSSTYPTTEQTLSALSMVVNAGGLGQVGDIVHSSAAALSGRAPQIREFLTRVDRFVATVDEQRDRLVAAITAMNRLAATFSAQRDTITEALAKIPPAIDVLLRERPAITTALDKLRVFSDTTTRLVIDAGDDLVTNLGNLAPTLQALADVGPGLDTVLAYVPTFPFTQNFLDRALRGDYFNVFAIADLTVPRLKRSMFLGTRWGDPNAEMVPAPGDPWYLNYSYEPVGAPAAPVAPPPVAGPVLPIAPPPGPPPAAPTGALFAGPYPSEPGPR